MKNGKPEKPKIPEYILCSAIWYKDLPIKKEKENIPLLHRLPINVDRGVVFCGHRHPHCMYHMVCIYGLRQCEAGEEIQGFLTSHNRFVDRTEGMKIATEQDQLKGPCHVGTVLYSENLY